MGKNLKAHYDNIATIYDELWTYSDDFVLQISREIINILELQENDILVDLGCGTGIYSKAIKQIKKLENKIICSDLSEKMLEALDKNHFETYAINAVNFSKIRLRYNKVFIKEMIHHLSDNEKKVLYRNLYKNINKNGILSILLLPPTIEYPLFPAALKLYEKLQPHYDSVKKGLEHVGFSVDIHTIKYPLKIEKDRYFNMVKNRYMSLLSEFSDSEINAGINYMRAKYSNTTFLEFNDVFIAVTGIKI